MRAEVLEALPNIDAPCQEISFSYAPDHTAQVRMSFGDTHAPSKILSLKFKGVVVISGEEECPGGFVQGPRELPKLGRGETPEWTFPLLRIQDSPSLDLYRQIYSGGDRRPLAHFFLVSLHNLVHVIASVDVEADWSSA